MSVVHSVYHLMRVDFLERVRRSSFLIVMGVTVYVGYMMVPPIGASYNTFVIYGYRGFYNSPWVGTVFGVVVSTLLTLIGFYLVKNAVSRDYLTRVGQIIATTPISKPIYMLGKWLSNVAVLVLILIVFTVMAYIMQLVRAEDVNVDLWALVAPIWLMGLPILAIVSAVAVLFESVPILRSGFGNIIYFFVWFSVLMISVGRMFMSVSDITLRNDFAGLSKTIVDIYQQLTVNGMDTSRGSSDLFVPTGGREIVRFVWDGIDWTAKIFFERLTWLGAAVVIALAAAIPFDRFDPARRRIRWQRKRKQPRPELRVWQKLLGAAGVSRSVTNDAVTSNINNVAIDLTQLHEKRPHRRFWAILLAEVRLMIKGQKWWWYAVALGLIIASLFSPLDVVRRYLFPAAWLWPILLWSALGNREGRYHTSQIVFSTAHSLGRQLPATWLAGIMVAIITGGGTGFRLILAGQWSHLLAWGIGAGFIPSLALALGIWSGSSHLFEIVYVLLWYLGSVNRIPALDYMGVTPEAIADGVPIICLVASILLFGIAAVGRGRQLQT